MKRVKLGKQNGVYNCFEEMHAQKKKFGRGHTTDLKRLKTRVCVCVYTKIRGV